MLVAELAQILAKARAISKETLLLVEQAPSDVTTDDAAQLYELIADLQTQIDELRARST